MGEYNEYVFCPHCGGITIPGICVNCGRRTSADTPADNEMQDMVHIQDQQVTESSYEKYQPKGQPVSQGYESYYSPNNVNGYNQSPVNNQVHMSNQMPGNNQSPVVNSVPLNTTYEPPKKSHWWIWLLVIGLFLFLGIIFVVVAIIVAFIFFGTTTTISSSSLTTQYTPQASVTVVPEAQDDYEYAELGLTVYGRELERLDFSAFDWENAAENAMIYSETDDGSNDFFLNKDYESSFGSNHDNHTLSEFTGMYYEPFVDCIDTSYDYGLSRHFISYSDVEDNMMVNANIAYIQLEGNTVPNEDDLNRRILEMTANDFWGYLDGQKSLAYTPSDVTFIVDSFIPYNDGEKMSILLDANVYYDGYQEEHYIYGINIDLVNGEIMDNGSILEIDEDFAAMFRERNDAQNGTDVVGVINTTDEELAGLLANPDTNIIFYSPYGMEIGFNYMADGYSWGWVSITLSDYENYLQ